jgi:hypothetical protein
MPFLFIEYGLIKVDLVSCAIRRAPLAVCPIHDIRETLHERPAVHEPLLPLLLGEP